MPRPQDKSIYADEINSCYTHGQFQGGICPKCHAAETIRIEKESAELRVMRTPDFMRRERARLLAEGNGAQ